MLEILGLSIISFSLTIFSLTRIMEIGNCIEFQFVYLFTGFDSQLWGLETVSSSAIEHSQALIILRLPARASLLACRALRDPGCSTAFASSQDLYARILSGDFANNEGLKRWLSGVVDHKTVLPQVLLLLLQSFNACRSKSFLPATTSPLSQIKLI